MSEAELIAEIAAGKPLLVGFFQKHQVVLTLEMRDELVGLWMEGFASGAKEPMEMAEELMVKLCEEREGR